VLGDPGYFAFAKFRGSGKGARGKIEKILGQPLHMPPPSSRKTRSVYPGSRANLSREFTMGDNYVSVAEFDLRSVDFSVKIYHFSRGR